jgi:hypothetical protein
MTFEYKFQQKEQIILKFPMTGQQSNICLLYSSSVGKLDQAGRAASASTGLYRPKGQINPGDTGSHPKQLHIRGDIKTTNKHLFVLDPMVFLYIF